MNRKIVDYLEGLDQEDSRIYKTVEFALDNITTNGTIIVKPGSYSGINLETITKKFEFELEGSGNLTELNFYNFKGLIELKTKTVRLQEVSINTNFSVFSFIDVDFYGNNKFFIDGSNEIEFVNCSFGVNYQLIIKNGQQKITFKNCSFRGCRTIPIIYSKFGKHNIYAMLCNITSVPFIFNVSSSITIYKINCLIEFLYSGEYCKQKTEDFETEESAQLLYSFESNRVKNNSSMITRTVNTDDYFKIRIDIKTKFLRLIGTKDIIIEFPNIKHLSIGHKIEIVNESQSFILEGITYYNSYCKIILLEEGWFVYCKKD